METLYTEIIEQFLYKIEKDRKFFSYYNNSNSESMQLVERRAMNYLNEAIVLFSTKTFTNVLEKNDSGTGFKNTLTSEEVYILTNLMYEIHLKRDLAVLKAMSDKYAPTDLNTFSPANERKSFLLLVEKIENENTALIDTYCVRDRQTGNTKVVV